MGLAHARPNDGYLDHISGLSALVHWVQEICLFPIENVLGGGQILKLPIQIHSLWEMDKFHWYVTLENNQLMHSNFEI